MLAYNPKENLVFFLKSKQNCLHGITRPTTKKAISQTQSKSAAWGKDWKPAILSLPKFGNQTKLVILSFN